MIYGNIICQNALPDILRTIESIAPICDKIYICDGFSTDGTWEWLQNVKDIYRLELCQNKYESMVSQRNFLLSKTPENAWVISIDQDEEITSPYELKELLFSLKLEGVMILRLPMVTMTDINHCSDFFYLNENKVFYNENIKFGINDYHAILTSEGLKQWNYIPVPEFIAIKHYALLDPKRSKARCKRLKGNKEAGQGEYEFWCEKKHTVIDLPEILR